MKKYLFFAVIIAFTLPQISFAQNAENKTVARIFNKDIQQNDLKGDKQGRVLFGMLLSQLVDRFFKDNNISIAATPEEIESLKKMMNSASANMPADLRAKMEENESKISKEETDRLNNFKNDMYKQMIVDWKRNKALYDHFKGDVIYQQLGSEPLGAFRALIQQAQNSGDFILIDKSLEEDFNWYLDPKIHVFACKNDDAECDAFSKPIREMKK